MTIPGVVVVALAVLVVMGGLIYEFVRSRGLQPKYWVQTPTTRVGVRWHVESTNWPGLERAIFAIEHVLYLRYGAEVVRKKGLMDFWIDVYERNATMRTTASPTGLAGGRQLTGAVERMGFYFGFQRKFVLLIRQLHKSRVRLPNGDTWQEGELLDAGASALFHEVAEHYVPFMLKNDINAGHSDEWKMLTSEMRQAYRMFGEVNGKAD